jgi:AsmA protein
VDGKLAVRALRYAGLDLEGVSLGIKAKGGQLRLAPLRANLYGGKYAGDIRIDARGETPQMQLDEKVSSLDAATLLAALGIDTGALDLRGGRTDLALKANVGTDARGQRVLARGISMSGRVAGRSFRGGPAPVSLSGDVAVDLGARTATLEGVKAAFAELAVAGNLKLGFAPGARSYAGRVSVTPFDARRLAGRLNVPLPRTADPKALTRVGGSAAVDGTDKRLRASELDLQLDGSRIRGEVAVADFATQALAFDLSADRLDVDRYLPPSAKGKAATPGAAATALPVDLVRSLNLNGRLKVGALKVGGVSMTGVEVTAQAKDGQLKLSPLGAALYGGRYAGNVSVDARQSLPRIAMDETITAVQIGPLLRDVTGDAPVSGATDLRAVLRATGGDTEALKRSLNGDVRFAIRDGALEKVDMVSSMCTALAALDFDNLNRETIAAGVIGLLMSGKQSSAPQAAGGGGGTRTEFTEMSGSARLDDGVARNDDLVMVSPVVRVRGAGAVSLPAEQIDYRAEAELVQSCAGIGQRDLAGHVIPVTVTGPIADPKVTPTIPAGLIRALRKRRTPQPAPAQPAATAPAPAPTQQPPPQQEATQPQQPQKSGHVIKDTRDKLLQDIFKGILK